MSRAPSHKLKRARRLVGDLAHLFDPFRGGG
jgi:hypothetical protein